MQFIVLNTATLIKDIIEKEPDFEKHLEAAGKVYALAKHFREKHINLEELSDAIEIINSDLNDDGSRYTLEEVLDEIIEEQEEDL